MRTYKPVNTRFDSWIYNETREDHNVVNTPNQCTRTIRKSNIFRLQDSRESKITTQILAKSISHREIRILTPDVKLSLEPVQSLICMQGTLSEVSGFVGGLNTPVQISSKHWSHS